jgi:two-component system, OmpR family, sensor histidine kinase TctE
MKVLSAKSLRATLALRLAALYVAATAIAVGILIFQAYETADSLNDRELGLRAADLARYVTVDSAGTTRLDLPPQLAASYQAAGEADIFVVRRNAETVLAASPPNFGEVVVKWPTGTDDPSYFRLRNFGSAGREYYGLTVVQNSAAGPLSISVAHAADADVLVDSLLREFVMDIGWLIPLMVGSRCWSVCGQFRAPSNPSQRYRRWPRRLPLGRCRSGYRRRTCRAKSRRWSAP